jgi:pimeloyl-ACP methyl ester carboxylesterase
MSRDLLTAIPARPGLTRRDLSDLRGTARLLTEATLGVTAVVEAMHARIASLPGLPAPARTRGIARLAYGSVDSVTRLVGGAIDGALALLPPLRSQRAETDAEMPSPEREALLAALNGVLGDHLAATGNPLALTMALRHQGRTLALDRSALQAALPQATGRVLVLLHGLCMNDLQWQREGHDHGAALAQACGYTPLYLRYNSGLPVRHNGASFAELMESLLLAWPRPIERVVLLAHSMGGLVARSALHQGDEAGHRWPSCVDDAVFLGTPHQGAPLERAGHGLDLLLGAVPYAAPLARLGRLRSAGINDLRHGLIAVGSRPVPLPDRPRCHAVAACLGAGTGRLQRKVLGDGLVPVDSALGRHADPAQALHFEPGREHVFDGMNHMALLNRPEVTQALRRWLCADTDSREPDSPARRDLHTG